MPRVRESLVSAALVLAGSARGGFAQSTVPADGEPVVVGADAPKWDWFDLARLDLAFELYGQGRHDKISGRDEPTRTNSEFLLRQTLNVDTEFYIGHRNLVDFSGFVKLGLEESWLNNESVDQEGQEVNFANLYDLSALILGTSKVPVTVYTMRDQQFLDRAFNASIVSTVTETGVQATLQSEKAPTTIKAFHNENDQDSQERNSDYSYIQNSVSLINTLLFAENHRLETSYTFNNITEDFANSEKNIYDTNDLLMTDVLNFGTDGRNEARTYLRFYDQTGSFGFRSLRLEEQVYMYHSESLESRYNARAQRLERDDVDQNLVNASATVIHKVFDSLVTSATAGGDYFETSDNFDSNGVYLQGTMDYTKLVWLGRFDAGFGGGVNSQRNGERGNPLSVVDQPETYNEPFPITIVRRNIEEGSVRVTGPGGFPTFIEGVDYTIEYFNDRVEITPILGGAISNGQSVSVDYVIGPEPSSNINTYDTNISFRYTFTEGLLRGFAVFSSYRTVTHDIETDDPELIALDDIRNLLYGAEYRRGLLGLKAQHENQDSTQNPYDVTSFQAFFDYPLGPGSNITMDANYDIIDFERPVNHVDFFRFTGRWNHRWTSHFDTLLRMDYRNEEDERQGNTQGVDALISLRWQARQTSMYVTFRSTLVGAPATDTESQYLEFGFRRDF